MSAHLPKSKRDATVIVLAACWAHARRKFYDLHEATGSPIAAEALRRIAELYAIERSIRGRTADARRHVRNTSARPLIEMMKPWLEMELGRVPPAGPLAEAIRYALARWPALTRFLDDGRIEPDIRGLGRWRRPMGNHLLPHRHRKAQQRRALCLATSARRLLYPQQQTFAK